MAEDKDIIGVVLKQFPHGLQIEATHRLRIQSASIQEAEETASWASIATAKYYKGVPHTPSRLLFCNLTSPLRTLSTLRKLRKLRKLRTD